MFEHVHGSVDVEVDGASPGLGIGLGDRPDGLGAAGAVHHAVQPAVPPCRRLDDALNLFLVGDIGGLEAHLCAGSCTRRPCGDFLRSRRQPPSVAADDHHVGPGQCQPGGHPLPIPLPPPVTR